MNLYLLRHGETDWNAEGRLQGQTDIPLNEKGKVQMLQVAEELKKLGIRVDLVITSPLLRARQSAEIVSEMLGYKRSNILVEPLLIERNFGDGEGKTWSELLAQYPEGICTGREPFGRVEPLEELVGRGQAAFEKIVNTHAEEKNIIVVAHGALLSALLTAVTKGKIEYGGEKVRFTQGSIYLVRYMADTIEVAGYEAEKVQFLTIEGAMEYNHG